MLSSEISKSPTDPPVRGFPVVWKLLLLHDSLPILVSIPNSFVSHFVFCILSYLLSKRMDCLSGCVVSSDSIQKLYSGSCSSFKWSFDEFVGEKVGSPSYSSGIFFSNLSLKYFKISLEISSLIHMLFRSLLFNFGDFPVIFMLLIFNLVSLSESKDCMFLFS